MAIFPESKALDFRVFIRLVGREDIIAEEILFRDVLRHYVSQNIDAIIGTLRLNRFDFANSLCCMYLIDRFSQLLRCEVVFHFINT